MLNIVWVTTIAETITLNNYNYVESCVNRRLIVIDYFFRSLRFSFKTSQYSLP